MGVACGLARAPGSWGPGARRQRLAHGTCVWPMGLVHGLGASVREVAVHELVSHFLLGMDCKAHVKSFLLQQRSSSHSSAATSPRKRLLLGMRMIG